MEVAVATLNATVGSPAANSYLTRAEALEILTTRRLHSSAWMSVTPTQQDAALMWATRLIDQGFDWTGAVRTLEQSLRWPRAGMRDLDYRWVPYDTVPERLKDAVADLALALIQRDRTGDPELHGLGFSQARVANLSVTVDRSMVLRLIPKHIIDTLTIWGVPINPQGSGGMSSVPLERV
jgi:hypothetical protein